MFTSKSQPKFATLCENNHNICMDEDKQKTPEYNIDSTHSLDTINKSNRKAVSNSKKPHRKASFKNVKDFMSRIVMRQLQLQPYDSEQFDYSCNTSHDEDEKRYFTNLNSCGDSAIVSVATVTPIGDTLLNVKYKGDQNISVMSAPKSNHSNSTMASNVSCNPSAVTPLSETSDGTKYKHYNSCCESTIRPLLTHNNNNNGINSDQNIRHGRQNKFKTPVWNDTTPGTVGLYNHGNTCFMNAVLQCISNASFLSGYFVMGHYKEELKNNKNVCKKFGSSGEVTEQLGILLRSIWSGKYNPDISSDFKTVIGKYNSQFKGFNQHDAQEFLLWLLDQVHEDLNLPIKKSKNNQQGKFSSEKRTMVSELSLSKQTIIYQMFRGLYQSSLTCLKCRRQSNTYDPYLCLSLPLPQICNRAIYIIIVYLDPNVTLKRIGILMKNTETFGDLRKCLSQLPSHYPAIPKLKYLLCQIDDNGYCNSYSDSKLLSDVAESEDIYLFELPTPVFQPEISLTSNFHDQQDRRHSYEMSSINILLVHAEQINSTAVSGKCIRFCCPHIISVLRDISYPDLQNRILQSLGPALKENLSNYSMSKQKLLMRLHVMDRNCQHNYLPNDVEMPLYMPVIDKVLGVHDGNLEELPLRIIVEWDSHLWEMIVNHTAQLLEEHSSVINVQTMQQKMGHTTLKDCFYLYTQEEKLSGDAWRCPHCRHQQTGAIKKLRLCSLPEILVVHLKRFKQVKMQRNKVDILVDFPMWSLDLSQYLVNFSKWNQHMHDGYSSTYDESLRDAYDLFAVCNHYGNLIGGHYTAFCKNPVDGSWYQFDDTQVKPISKKEVVTKAAYLLFYQHRELFKHQKDELLTGTHWICTLHGASSSLDCASDPPPRPTSYSIYQSPALSSDQTSSCQPDSAVRMNPYDHPCSSPPVHFVNSTTFQSTRGIPKTHTNSSDCNYQSLKTSEEEHSFKISAERQQNQKTSGQITNPGTRTELKKFATIARTENRFDNNSSVVFSRSKTYDDIKSCSQLSSKKSNISQGSETQSITEPIRYQPQLHLHKYKEQTSAFHKKKLLGPCLKESSV
ncbi:ubiquitin carboxyl-terminal hydrolase 31 [Octopus vulgaris]|uniref:ubiquitinyl hydrolase 1 n=1 Tax=Octopus vulgaris TaxID=6645 RepID=A0AA36FEM1_OCTVU|nr:ubiquitin carboxyl-terminal hydrolase 31 [Octopus vulgaris]